MLLALLSKSIVMTLPLVLVLLDVYPLRRVSLTWGLWRTASARSVLKEKVPYFALGLAGAITAYGRSPPITTSPTSRSSAGLPGS